MGIKVLAAVEEAVEVREHNDPGFAKTGIPIQEVRQLPRQLLVVRGAW